MTRLQALMAVAVLAVSPAVADTDMQVACEGSGNGPTQALCSQVDEATVHLVASARHLGPGSRVTLRRASRSTLVVGAEADGGKEVANETQTFELTFTNEGASSDEVNLFWMMDASKVGRFIAKLQGGASHVDNTFPGSIYRLTTKRREFIAGRRCKQTRGADFCTAFDEDIRSGLEKRQYAEVVDLYEVLGRRCVVGTAPGASHNQLLPRIHAEVEVSAAKLRHEALQWRHLVGSQRVPETPWLQLADHFEHVAKSVDGAWGRNKGSLLELYSDVALAPALKALEPESANQTVVCHINERAIEGTIQRDTWGTSVLHTSTDFGRVLMDFWTKGVAIIDDVLSPEALEEFQHYILEEARYTKVREKYMEASPPTFQPRVLVALARELEARLPEIFQFPDTHLMRWWAFQQVDAHEQPRNRTPDSQDAQTGVDMHADAAMVSLNLFATPDEAQVSGGGLHIWHVLPTDSLGFNQYNKAHWEPDKKAKILEHPRETVPYKYNRAALFMSDLFHETEDFEFKPGHAGQRINVAVLWGGKKPSGTLFHRRPERFNELVSIPKIEL